MEASNNIKTEDKNNINNNENALNTSFSSETDNNLYQMNTMFNNLEIIEEEIVSPLVQCYYCQNPKIKYLVRCMDCFQFFCNGNCTDSDQSHYKLHLYHSGHRTMSIYPYVKTLKCTNCKKVSNIYKLNILNDDNKIYCLECLEKLKKKNFDSLFDRDRKHLNKIVEFYNKNEYKCNYKQIDYKETKRKYYNLITKIAANRIKLQYYSIEDYYERMKSLLCIENMNTLATEFQKHQILVNLNFHKHENLFVGEFISYGIKDDVYWRKGDEIVLTSKKDNWDYDGVIDKLEVRFDKAVKKINFRFKLKQKHFIDNGFYYIRQKNCSISNIRMLKGLDYFYKSNHKLYEPLTKIILGIFNNENKNLNELDDDFEKELTTEEKEEQKKINNPESEMMDINKIPANLNIQCFPKLDVTQSNAVRFSLKHKLTIIQGSPATGKTLLASFISYYLYKYRIDSHSKVLLCAPSNNICEKLCENLGKIKEIDKDLDVLHIYSKDRELIPSNKEKNEFALHEKIYKINKTLLNLKEKHLTNKGLNNEEYFNFKKLKKEMEMKLIQESKIIISTCNNSYDDRIQNQIFDFVIIDDCNQGLESDCLLPLIHNAKHIVLLGDIYQRGPIIHNYKCRELGLDVSLFERLHSNYIKTNVINLGTQYRMCSFLYKFVKENFYYEQQNNIGSSFEFKGFEKKVDLEGLKENKINENNNINDNNNDNNMLINNYINYNGDINGNINNIKTINNLQNINYGNYMNNNISLMVNTIPQVSSMYNNMNFGMNGYINYRNNILPPMLVNNNPLQNLPNYNSNFSYNNNNNMINLPNEINTNTPMTSNSTPNSHINLQNNIENSSPNSQIINSNYLDLSNVFLNKDYPTIFYNIDDGKEERIEKINSYKNFREVEVIFNISFNLMNSNVDSSEICILAPYKIQKTLLVEKFKKIPDMSSIDIESFDAFQGKEKEYIIISLTRSNEEGKIGFIADYKKIILMLTRAKKGLIIVGNAKTFIKENIWKILIRFYQSYNLIYDCDGKNVEILDKTEMEKNDKFVTPKKNFNKYDYEDKKIDKNLVYKYFDYYDYYHQSYYDKKILLPITKRNLYRTNRYYRRDRNRNNTYRNRFYLIRQNKRRKFLFRKNHHHFKNRYERREYKRHYEQRHNRFSNNNHSSHRHHKNKSNYNHFSDDNYSFSSNSRSNSPQYHRNNRNYSSDYDRKMNNYLYKRKYSRQIINDIKSLYSNRRQLDIKAYAPTREEIIENERKKNSANERLQFEQKVKQKKIERSRSKKCDHRSHNKSSRHRRRENSSNGRHNGRHSHHRHNHTHKNSSSNKDNKIVENPNESNSVINLSNFSFDSGKDRRENEINTKKEKNNKIEGRKIYVYDENDQLKETRYEKPEERMMDNNYSDEDIEF